MLFALALQCSIKQIIVEAEAADKSTNMQISLTVHDTMTMREATRKVVVVEVADSKAEESKLIAAIAITLLLIASELVLSKAIASAEEMNLVKAMSSY